MALNIRWQHDVSALPVDEYTRVSVDKKGNGKSVADQHEDNIDCREDLGLDLGEWFNDGDKKATLGAKERPEWSRFLDKARAGRSGGLNIWDVSRASRDLGIGFELVRIVRDYGLKGFRVISSSTERVYDLSNEMDANSFQEELVRAEKEALVIQKRSRRGMRRRAQRGEMPGGPRRRFGFLNVHEGEWHEMEAELIQEADRRTRKDGTPKDVVNAWAERGIVTPRIMTDDGKQVRYPGGRQFDGKSIRSMLLRACNAGYVKWTDKGELYGRLPGEAIIPESNLLELRQILATQRRGRPPFQVHLLTGDEWDLMRCGPCKTVMSGSVCASRRDYYRCTYNPHKPKSRGCLQTIDMANLDEMISEAAFAWWVDPARLARDVLVQYDDPRVRELDELLRVLRTRHSRLVTSAVAGVDQSLVELEARMQGLGKERESLLSPVKIEAATRAQIVARWSEGPKSQRIMVREAIRSVTIWPFDHGSGKPRRFDPERVKVVFADEIQRAPELENAGD